MEEKTVGTDNVLKMVKGDAPPTDALIEGLRKDLASWSRHVEVSAYIAKIARTNYEALVKEGFDSSQALIVTMKWMWP